MANGNGTYLIRARIDDFAMPAYMDLEMPEWGGTVRLRRLDVHDRMGLSQAVKDGEPDLMFMARMVAYSLCDGAGQRLYADHEIDALMKQQLEPLRRIYDAAMEFSKVRPADVDTAEKNSVPSQSLPSSAN